MKVSEARSICPQFNPVKGADGKVGCSSHITAEDGVKLCQLPNQMVCLLDPSLATPAKVAAEVVAEHTIPAAQKDPREAAPNPAQAAPVLTQAAPAGTMLLAPLEPTLATVDPLAPMDLPPAPGQAPHGTLWSVSRLGIWQSCPRKYMLRYLAHADELVTPKAFVLGRIFHRTRELIDAGNWDGSSLILHPNDVISADDQIKMEEVLKAYQQTNDFKIVASEQHFVMDDLIQGYIDAVDVDWRLKEFKYAQETKGYSLLSQGRQLATYLIGFPQAVGIDLVIVHKPKEKFGKTDTTDSFRAKVAAGIVKNGVMTLLPYDRGDFNLDRERKELHAIIRQCEQDVEAFGKAGCFPGNRSTFTCPDCGYHDWCEATVSCPQDCDGECKVVSDNGSKICEICKKVSAFWRGR